MGDARALAQADEGGQQDIRTRHGGDTRCATAQVAGGPDLEGAARSGLRMPHHAAVQAVPAPLRAASMHRGEEDDGVPVRGLADARVHHAARGLRRGRRHEEEAGVQRLPPVIGVVEGQVVRRAGSVRAGRHILPPVGHVADAAIRQHGAHDVEARHILIIGRVRGDEQRRQRSCGRCKRLRICRAGGEHEGRRECQQQDDTSVHVSFGADVIRAGTAARQPPPALGCQRIQS